jgi:eukaryotic-like serine/threonine-protein kinase
MMAFKDLFKSLFPSKKLDVKVRFELLKEAMSGTMSQVYKARDRETDKVVALKILDRRKTENLEARFKGLKKPTEGEIAVQFDHPQIVKTYEHGLTTDGAQYLVMEFLEGVGMNSILFMKDKSLDGHRVSYIRQTAEALAVVHEAGFIHRDICPRNLLMAGDGRTMKLTDFGLSVPAHGHFLSPGNRTGTPNYMAPELVRRQMTDQRLDVFAFGVTVYEICTFELPWLAGNTGMTAMAHDTTPTDIKKYRPRINPELAEAIHACIQPELKKRCASMEDFLQMISEVEHEDVQE